MKLYLTATSERGKPVTKSGNEAIRMTVTNDRRNMFDIMFNGERLEVLRYSDAKIITVEYMESNGNIKCHQCRRYFYGLEGKEDICPSCLQKLM